MIHFALASIRLLQKTLGYLEERDVMVFEAFINAFLVAVKCIDRVLFEENPELRVEKLLFLEVLF